MSELPRGWATTDLGTVGEVYCGQSSTASDVNGEGLGTPYVTGPEQWTGSEIELNKWTTTPKRTVPEGCIFITVKGAGVGKMFPGIACAIGRDVYAYAPSKQLLYPFVVRALANTVNAVIREARGDIPGLSKEHITDHTVPLPPLAEQKRIVARLDALLAKSARARTELARIETLVARYKQAVLSKAFSKIEAESVSLLDLTEFVTSGSRGWAKFYSDTGPLFIRIGNTVRGTIKPDLNDIQRVNPPEGSEGMRTRVRPNDIVVTITADLGRVALIEEQMGEAYVNQHLALVRLLNPESAAFFAWYLVSDEGQAQLHRNNRGATRAGLGLEDIRQVEMPTPSLEEQHEIVRRIEYAFARVDRLAAEAKRALELVGKLDEAILSKAFRGELVPQDENDEPAEHLLARIRAEREAAPKGKRGRGAKA